MAPQVRSLLGRTVVLDAQPLVGAFRQEAARPVVEAVIEAAERDELELRLTAVTAGEVLYAIERALGPEAGRAALWQLQDWPIDIVRVDLELASRAAWVKLTRGIGYADAFVAALADRDGATIMTGDPDFGRVEDIVSVAWLDALASG